MASVLVGLQLATDAAFVLLTLAVVMDWTRHRDARSGHLGVAFGSLTALILLAPAVGHAGAFNQLLTDVTLVIFLLSGYALLMFRDALIPLGSVKRWVTLGIVAVALLAFAVQLPSDPQQRLGPLQGLAAGAFLITWGLCILEPIFRMWVTSMHRRAVESARLRALSLGYAALIAEIGAATLAGSAARTPYFVLVTHLVTLAIVPLLYVSFSPPSWLRRIWREPEEDAFRNALHDLLLYSPDRPTLAKRALGWATRLVGGASAVIVDADGSILAAREMTLEQAEAVAADLRAGRAVGNARSSTQPAAMLTTPLQLQQGEGCMVIVAGPFTPSFGEDEFVLLRQYANSISAGLDRVSLSERIASLEKAKTEFLNVASHELRGPMTVIKGYLTMLEAGVLGGLSAQSSSVVHLLIAKSDEVNWMVEQMVEAARLEEGRMALKKLPANLVELTDQAIEGVSQLLVKHQLSVERPSRAVEAEVDPDRFQIVVRNLLSNAAKYSPNGSRIRVRVTGNGVGMVAVTDEGIGIAEEDQARLFSRFVRIETKATERVSGTGLGLWLSREIARMHDGDLTVESTPGRGSTFTLRVPLST
ncbi:MAG TPA: HAMP domain-containing sensor histidine kinase [Candidatus Micrarchaeaceae archaeon]|nr:HAMP domain-containing sensor histidine kinase [Candidatus Micrarchaeaceae archaeon]